MAITRTPILDDDGTGTTGTVIDHAWKTEFYDQIDAAIPTGTWVDVPFNVANFWPGITAAMVPNNKYMRIGKTQWWMLQMYNAVVPTPSALFPPLVVPGGVQVVTVLSPASFANDGGPLTGVNLIALSPTTIGPAKLDNAAWTSYPMHLYFTAVLALE